MTEESQLSIFVWAAALFGVQQIADVMFDYASSIYELREFSMAADAAR